MAIDLKGKPFYLDEKAQDWVNQTLAGLTEDEKIGQLFCVCCREGTQEEVDWIFSYLNPGTILLRQMDEAELEGYRKMVGAKGRIPLLVAANLEMGGNGVATEGTLFSSPMGVAATGNVDNAYHFGRICGSEGKKYGVNWNLAPIIDIDYNWRSPITNVRTYGSNPDVVREMGTAYVKAVQEEGIAACAKHFPGDGRDERDQHLAVTINDLSCEEWDRTYGAAYKSCIDSGVKSVMVGHIIQMGYERALRPGVSDAELLPASLSPVIMKKLLREKLGFNGLIATDATTMAGFIIPMDRSLAVPLTIENGADILLLSRNLGEDIRFMKEGIEKGILTRERLDEAVTRILALKASLGLHKQAAVIQEETRQDSALPEAKEWARQNADQAITLVKEEKGVFPITPERYKRVLLFGIETAEKAQGLAAEASVTAKIKTLLEERGFEVDIYQPYKAFEGAIPEYRSITDNYDLMLYTANLTTKSNQTVVRIEWSQPFGSNTPVYSNVIPTVFVSFANPYHLIDVPRVKTFINAYYANDEVLAMLLDKMTGKSDFKGESPVDPFCGRWDTHIC